MKRKPYITNYRLLAMGLAFTAILASCKTLEQPTVPPAAIEMPMPASVMPVVPEMLLPNNNLVCPRIPRTAAPLPPAPYDEDLGDCALIGRSGEIEAWLTDLEQIAANCNANREANWASVLAARDDLDSQIDELDVVARINVCPSTPTSELGEPSGPYTPPYYTDWLKRIGEDVVKYCTMIDELVKPLSQACDEINFYQEFCSTDAGQFHSIIGGEMNAAQIDYDYTEFFYTNTLQTSGWGNFRLYFNEASIDCPRVQPPAAIALGPTTCRFGPRTIFPPISYLSKGQTVMLLNRNEDASWLEVESLDRRVGPCWVDTDLLDIPPLVNLLDLDLGFIPPEPTLTPPSSADTGGDGGGSQGCLWYDGQKNVVCYPIGQCPVKFEASLGACNP